MTKHQVIECTSLILASKWSPRKSSLKFRVQLTVCNLVPRVFLSTRLHGLPNNYLHSLLESQLCWANQRSGTCKVSRSRLKAVNWHPIISRVIDIIRQSFSGFEINFSEFFFSEKYTSQSTDSRFAKRKKLIYLYRNLNTKETISLLTIWP